MKQVVLGLFGTAAVVLSAGGCAQHGFEPIAVTRDASVVASCQKVDDVKVEDVKADEKLSDIEAQRQLAVMAREKGANTLLVASDAAREGTAYRCSMPDQRPAGTR